MAEKLPKKRWYVIQTYSGYEKAVRDDLERRVDSMGMQDFIYQIIVPEEKYIEKTKDGKDKEKIRQIYPGYVFVEMIVTDESWFVVRNTPRVTGFLGSSGGGTKPVPLLEEEIRPILLKANIISKPNYNYLLGKQVQIIGGAFEGQVGKVSAIDHDQETMMVDIDVFGRATPTEIDFTQFKEV
ncbi:Transcription antitermination protein nusG [Acholeplasma oculi]|uniref:Transcription termination/antitermination protein NusG n=1 Tax=Acholeplasma oculi TaxID=35623 RepID=A0A061AD73_9MOLU|nr:transcription termination/antitermination protein NusG [Acholeplasma oculi]CDR31379.1 Transcription antitermination protein NusG [Acholeplasma oculi]SKC39530.1 transcription antitermination protein nusG [Acholeplasma oculi]SUT91830.1 Transcription antitermination protein nusG [Acholeplasma oculi]